MLFGELLVGLIHNLKEVLKEKMDKKQRIIIYALIITLTLLLVCFLRYHIFFAKP